MNSRFYKKGIASFLLFALTLQITGPATLRLCRKSQIKSEIKAAIYSGISVNAITTFSFPLTNEGLVSSRLYWEEEGEEFIYQGHWYDVLSIHSDGKNITIKAIEDGRDDQLEDAWQQIASSGHSPHPSKHTPIKPFSVFLSDHIDYHSYIPSRNKKQMTCWMVAILKMAVDVPELPPGLLA